MLTTALVATTNIFFAAGAVAGPYGVHHTTPDTLTATFDTDDVIEGDKSGIFGQEGAVVVNNAGTIIGHGTYDGLNAEPDSGIVIAVEGSSVVNSGTITGAGTGISTANYYDAATNSLVPRAIGTVVTNTGTITGENNDGVRLIGGGTVTNSGTIQGLAGQFTDGISMFTLQGQDTSGQASIGTVSNLTGGTISGVRFGAILSGGGVVDNAGAMNGGLGAVLIQSDTGETGKTGTVTNSGTMTGGDAVSFAGSLQSSELINSGTIEGTGAYGVHNAAPGTLTLTNEVDGLIEGARSGIFGQEGAVVVNNAGTIIGHGTYDGLNAESDSGIVIAVEGSSVVNSGTIIGAGTGISTAHYYDAVTNTLLPRAIGTVVTNTGTITGQNNDGVRLIGGGTVTNSGTIEGVGPNATGTTDGISMFALQGQDRSGQTSIGTVTNQAGGTIAGQRFGILLTGGGVIDNAGTIAGSGPAAIQIQAVAGDTGRTGQLANSGVINGGAVLFNVAGTVENSGTMRGATGLGIGGSAAPSSVSNSGVIEGTVGYGVHNGGTGTITLTNAADGTITGATTGVFGETGAVDIDNAGTIRGNGAYDGFAHAPEGGITIAGGPSTITNSGEISGAGHGLSTAYFYNADTDRLEGRAVGTVVENSGTIRGDSNDGVRLIGGGTITNSGRIEGTGVAFADGISMFAYQGPASTGANTVAQDLTGITSIGTVDNLSDGFIDGDRFGIIMSNGGTVHNAGGIDGGVGGVLIQSSVAGMIGTVTNADTGLIGGGGVTFGGILESASLSNSGTIQGLASHGVYHGTSGTLTLTNAAGGTIDGALSGVFGQEGAVLVENAGMIRGNGSNLGGAAYPDAGIVIAVEGSSIVNSGTISGAGHGTTNVYFVDGAGVFVGRAIGTTIDNNGLIEGLSGNGIDLAGGGTVTNSGTIRGAAEGIASYAFADQDTSGSASISTITNSATGVIEGGEIAVYMGSGGVIDNAGTITGAEAAIQVVETRAEDTADVTNSGTINGQIVLTQNGDRLTNSGTINGDILMNGGDDLVTLNSGSSIVGLLAGGDGFDTVTLTGTSAVATAAQTITQMDDFEQLAVESGYWTTSGPVGLFDEVTIGANGTLKVNEIATPDGPSSAIGTASIVTDGLLVLDFDSDDVLADADGLTISGAGGVRLESEAIVSIDSGNLTYTGITDIANGGLILTGSLAGDVATTGDGTFQLGDGGTTGEFTHDLVNNGSFIFNRSDDYDFLGAFSGTGDFTKMGDGTLTFAGDYSYTGITRILGGTVRLAGQIDPTTEVELGGGTFDISGAPQTIAALSGTSHSSVVIDDSTLTVDQDSDTVYAGAIAGDGGLVLTGEGELDLTGTNTYTGPTTVEGGTLSVNGSIVSTVTVDGGTLGGNGTVGGVIATANGTIAPGNSIGRLQVAGNISFAAGSVYEVEADASGAADRVDATGTATISGGTVEVLAANGQYRGRTDYTILTANGGVSGRFTTVTSNLAFLTPTLGYSANAVTLSLLRNDIDFAAIATTPNQARAADAVEALGVGNALFETVLVQNAAGAQTAFDALSGEIHASVPSVLIQGSRYVRDALLDSAEGGEDGFGIWSQASGSWGQADARGGVAKVTTDYRGLIAGLNFNRHGFSVGVGGGASDADYRAGARASNAGVDSRFIGGHLGYAAGPFKLHAGAAFAWHDVDTARGVAFPGFSESPKAGYDATSRQIFGEIGYGFVAGPFAIEPFARYAHVRVKTDGFTEAPGSAALTVGPNARTVQYATLGLKLDGVIETSGGARILPRLMAGWQHGWGDLTGRADARFAGSATNFTVIGAQLPGDAVTIDGGLAVEFGRFSIGAAYTGSVAESWADHGGRLRLSVRF